MGLKGLIIFGIAIFFNALANILIKASSFSKVEESVEGFLASLFNPWLIGGLASFGLAFLAYRHVLSLGIPLSVAYPIMTTMGFAIVLVASRFLFSEQLDWIQYTGIGFLVLGLWLVASRMQAA